MRGLILFCRSGFEGEAGREAAELGRARGAELRLWPGDGYAVVEGLRPGDEDILKEIGSADLVFSRQAFQALESVELPPAGDRADVLARATIRLAERVGWQGLSGVFVEAPDSEAGRHLWPLCTRLQKELAIRLSERGLLRPRAPGGHLHAFLADRTRAHLGTADPGRSSPWPMGIPRLRFSRHAPSRSALKLEEAFLVFLSEKERRDRLRPGARAVDLGASPGGWTWELARRGVVVTAVDNGSVSPTLLDTGLVEHVRADGFTWRPDRPVRWLVCDMVTAPARVAKLVGVWAAKGLCQEAVFNLKLPSSGPLDEVRRCAAIVARELERGRTKCALRFKHLYHDRNEVTGHLFIESRDVSAGIGPADRPERRAPRGEKSGKPGGRRKRRAQAAGKRRR